MRNETYALGYGLGGGALLGGALVASPALLAGGGAVLVIAACVDLLQSYRNTDDSQAFEIIEPVQIASDDAYDYADGIEDGCTDADAATVQPHDFETVRETAGVVGVSE